MATHIDGPTCPGCEKKLDGGHPLLREWFHKIKGLFPECHTSWVWRGEQDQRECFRAGKSNANWPTSPHNTTRLNPDTGLNEPYSSAMDLFRQVNGAFSAQADYFKSINAVIKAMGCPLEWGGSWVDSNGRPLRLGDLDHFQVPVTLRG